MNTTSNEKSYFDLHTSGTEAWTREGEVLGSFSISGGRGQSGSFLHHRDEVRVWRREVASLDGSMKAVVHLWFRGDKRIGAAHGTLAFEAH